MKTLSSYLFRVAGLSVIVAITVMFAAVWFGDWLTFRNFELGLPEALRTELNGDTTEISYALSNALNTFYTSLSARAVLPIAALLGLLTGGLTGMMHARRLLRPIDAVALAASRLAQGQTDARAEARPSRITEIDAFQNNFNEMANAIQRSERDIRDMNAAIAHELRTPLTILIGRINGMLDGVFPIDREGLTALLVQTGQLQHIADDLQLLTLAKAGRFDLQPEAVRLDQLVGAELSGDAADDIETDLSPALVEADPKRVRQILAALMMNARRYGQIGLRVEVAMQGAQGVLQVMDRGPGLAPDEAPRAFDSFWRADPSRAKDSSGGTGLGLAVVRSLAEAHGGQARYLDRPGGGAIFLVELPAAGSQDDEASRPRNRS